MQIHSSKYDQRTLIDRDTFEFNKVAMVEPIIFLCPELYLIDDLIQYYFHFSNKSFAWILVPCVSI